MQALGRYIRTGFFGAALALLAIAPARAQEVTVFAAASLTDVLTEIGAAYEALGGNVRFSFAASSTLARQIEAGAPADIYIAANTDWMEYLGDKGLIVASSRVPVASTRLVLVSYGDVRIDVAHDDIAALLGDDRLAVGDPAHVPAGMYAKQALQSLGQWAALAPKLARADNVRAALALVSRGEAPLGIVYETDVGKVDGVHVAAVFPAETHAPIIYPMAMVTDASSTDAMPVFDFLKGPQARAIFAKFGFNRPQ